MKTLDIFKSEGGFRVAGGIHNDGPVMGCSPWFETRDEAEKARQEMIDEQKRQEMIEDLIEAGDIDSLENL